MTAELLMSFLTLSLLEIVLGIDNLIFIALVADQLPPHLRLKARMIGLSLALIMRVIMLFSLSWIMKLTEPVFAISMLVFSWKDLLLLAGGVFLVYKAGKEMWADARGHGHGGKGVKSFTSFGSAVVQIVIVDFVFSFDSIITAVGLTDNLYVMVSAVVVSMVVMLVASGQISSFLRKYPNFKMIALAFVVAIGVLLVLKGFHIIIPKEYLYAAFVFSLFTEWFNTMAAKARHIAEVKEGLKIKQHEKSVDL